MLSEEEREHHRDQEEGQEDAFCHDLLHDLVGNTRIVEHRSASPWYGFLVFVWKQMNCKNFLDFVKKDQTCLFWPFGIMDGEFLYFRWCFLNFEAYAVSFLLLFSKFAYFSTDSERKKIEYYISFIDEWNFIKRMWFYIGEAEEYGK